MTCKCEDSSLCRSEEEESACQVTSCHQCHVRRSTSAAVTNLTNFTMHTLYLVIDQLSELVFNNQLVNVSMYKQLQVRDCCYVQNISSLMNKKFSSVFSQLPNSSTYSFLQFLHGIRANHGCYKQSKYSSYESNNFFLHHTSQIR